MQAETCVAVTTPPQQRLENDGNTSSCLPIEEYRLSNERTCFRLRPADRELDRLRDDEGSAGTVAGLGPDAHPDEVERRRIIETVRATSRPPLALPDSGIQLRYVARDLRAPVGAGHLITELHGVTSFRNSLNDRQELRGYRRNPVPWSVFSAGRVFVEKSESRRAHALLLARCRWVNEPGDEPAGGRQHDRRDHPHDDQATRSHDPNFHGYAPRSPAWRRGCERAPSSWSASAWSRFTIMTAARTAFASNAIAAPAICWSVRVLIPPSLGVWR